MCVDWRQAVLELRMHHSIPLLATKTGVSVHALSSICRGRVSNPTWQRGESIRKLHAILCPATHVVLFNDDDDASNIGKLRHKYAHIDFVKIVLDLRRNNDLKIIASECGVSVNMLNKIAVGLGHNSALRNAEVLLDVYKKYFPLSHEVMVAMQPKRCTECGGHIAEYASDNKSICYDCGKVSHGRAIT